MTTARPVRSLLCPLVGAFHRPPAKTVLEVLPIGTALLLVPEPENPYDVGAIRVMVDLAALCAEDDLFGLRLGEALDVAGADATEVIEASPLQLGYCAATGGKPLAKLTALWGQTGLVPVGNADVAAAIGPDGISTVDWFAALTFGPDGHPAVKVTIQPSEAIAEGEGEETNWGDGE